MKYVAPDKLYPVHELRDGAIAARVALGKLKALAAGAAIVRKELDARQSGAAAMNSGTLYSWHGGRVAA